MLIELQSESASLSDSKTQDILKSLFNVIDQLYGENEALSPLCQDSFRLI